MQITKYEHACVVITNEGQSLVIDPGVYSLSLEPKDSIDCVLITHKHPDHIDHDIIKNIKNTNPNATIASVQEVADEASDIDIKVIEPGAGFSCGPFTVQFFGGKHELFDLQNVGILVNDYFYYPGDSYSLPDTPVEVLALPASAPWMRLPDAAEFLRQISPKHAFPTHNALLSDIGKEIHYNMLSEAAKQTGTTWHQLEPSESLEL